MSLDAQYLLSNSEIRQTTRSKLQGNWGNPIGVCIVVALIMGAANYTGIVGLIIGGPIYLGLSMFFLKFVRRDDPLFENTFDGFKNFGNALGLYLLSALFVALWTLLFVIPGIIKTYAYSQVFYILADEPEISPMDAITKSRHMMRGAKGKLFLMHLNFFLLSILCLFTLGIGFIWLIPYMNAVQAEFYEDLKKNYVNDGEL